MKIAFFDTHRFDKDSFSAANAAFNFEIDFLEPRLTETTASLAKRHDVVCAFANDSLNRKTLEVLKSEGIKLIALRCAGYNCVDLEAAKELSLPIVRVPAYSPHAVAEHAVALLLTVTRQVHRAHARVREGNFSLDGLVGTELHGKKVGVLGTGKIGSIFAQIMTGFGCEVLAFDLKPNPELLTQKKISYTTLEEIFKVCDIISLHLPLTPNTRHLIDANAISKMKKGVILLNTGRGGLIDTKALITALKKGQIGSAGLDVYEEEEEIFFRDHSSEVLQDDVLARLMTFPNVLITAHQAFLTDTALRCIAETTLQNISEFKNGLTLTNQIL